MAQQLVLLGVGFVLTTLIGGYLQNRGWRHQFAAQKHESIRQAAESALHEVGCVLDKRRYRMLRIFWFLQRDDDGPGEMSGNEIYRQYHNVLFDWNDNLSRRLALMGAYFGGGMRARLSELYEEYRQLGRLLNDAARARQDGKSVDLSDIGQRLEALNSANDSYIADGLQLLLSDKIADTSWDSATELGPLRLGSATGDL